MIGQGLTDRAAEEDLQLAARRFRVRQPEGGRELSELLAHGVEVPTNDPQGGVTLVRNLDCGVQIRAATEPISFEPLRGRLEQLGDDLRGR